jgi:hypothetical protein
MVLKLDPQRAATFPYYFNQTVGRFNNQAADQYNKLGVTVSAKLIEIQKRWNANGGVTPDISDLLPLYSPVTVKMIDANAAYDEVLETLNGASPNSPDPPFKLSDKLVPVTLTAPGVYVKSKVSRGELMNDKFVSPVGRQHNKYYMLPRPGLNTFAMAPGTLVLDDQGMWHEFLGVDIDMVMNGYAGTMREMGLVAGY